MTTDRMLLNFWFELFRNHRTSPLNLFSVFFRPVLFYSTSSFLRISAITYASSNFNAFNFDSVLHAVGRYCMKARFLSQFSTSLSVEVHVISGKELAGA